MDDLLTSASNGIVAPVVRQFAPSRIERQLLAQVFELVWDQRKEADEGRRAGQWMPETHRAEDQVEVLATRFARRHAA